MTPIRWTGVVLALAVLFLGTSACGTRSPASSPTASAATATPVAYRSVAPPAAPVKGERGPYGEPSRKVDALARPLGRFALALLAREAEAHPDGNVVLSPASVHDALTMTCNGAGGQTAAEMQRALGLDALGLQPADQAWADLITYLHGKKDAQIRVANSLWLRDGVSFSPSFLQTDRDYFAADASSLPPDMAQAVEAINRWIEQRTGGRITQLLTELDPRTVAVLVNTVYVKAGWIDELFDKAATRPEPFTLPDGAKVNVPMMHGRFYGHVVSTPEYDAVPVPANGSVDVTVVVPKGDQTPESVVELLGQRGLESLREGGRYLQVDLALPRFEARFHDSLKPALQEMGMTQAFSQDQADFSGLADVKPLWVDDVVHEAVLEVNEEGVEAAGGTAVVLVGALPMPKTLSIRADRPFVVVLSVGSYTHLPLFVAIVRDPR